VPSLQVVRQEEVDPAGLAADVLLVVLVTAELADPGTPAVPFGLTAAMARSDVGPSDVVDALMVLRDAMVEAGALDAASEPVPLIVGEPAVAALSLASYLRQLLDRAAAHTGAGRDEVAERALALVRSR